MSGTDENDGDVALQKKMESDKLPPIPEGMSKSQWKKKWKKIRFENNKEKHAEVRREKRKRARETRRTLLESYKERGEPIPQELVREPRVNVNQKDSGIKLLIDCAFDDLMNDKEIVSLSNQLTRAYASNKRSNHFADVKVTSFNKRLQERFSVGLKDTNYENWKNFVFLDNEELITEPTDKLKMVYLTADTDENLQTLEPGMTYIVGGIVDKNRHKLLCYNKAKELGIATKRLPLDEFIKIDGRRVLTTTHVVDIMLKYFDTHDWRKAFETVLPPRKIDIAKMDMTVVDSDDEDEEEVSNNAESKKSDDNI
ncbi:hypothetical protein KAFR_0C01370 [Kazachstania africana CBS 2517]|uniref:tRNA (guanine(9)-N1)-methyltransferase n=1 Tax=Kazachstania africana (strain ATCC 22294 / BCRC 22015 / CBS 2517 / CECT 1963 / NBRC 1671 / NRRL Y-8276) TaxID=1071382 RepID=H2ARY0_KAZAF|nr:hypothetical protein KAFR_0C01370 [Kazachstania africana CBS 2517]CCF57130.1 hypothetical protein KAFR_0C01370 [Kazachstania africana CBS 2517]